MAYTVEQRAELAEAIASGVRSVTHGGTTVTYQTLDDMLRALALMDAELGTVTVGSRPQRLRFVGTKGLW